MSVLLGFSVELSESGSDKIPCPFRPLNFSFDSSLFDLMPDDDVAESPLSLSRLCLKFGLPLALTLLVVVGIWNSVGMLKGSGSTLESQGLVLMRQRCLGLGAELLQKHTRAEKSRRKRGILIKFADRRGRKNYTNSLLNCGDAMRMFFRNTGLMPGLGIALQLPFIPVEAVAEGDFPLSTSINWPWGAFIVEMLLVQSNDSVLLWENCC